VVIAPSAVMSAATIVAMPTSMVRFVRLAVTGGHGVRDLRTRRPRHLAPASTLAPDSVGPGWHTQLASGRGALRSTAVTEESKWAVSEPLSRRSSTSET
jgi:hypothetical protein